MENGANTIADIERIVAFVILAITAIGGLITSVTTARKTMLETKTKASVDVSTVQLAKDKSDHEIAVAKEKADREAKQAELDIIDRTEKIYTKMAEDVEKKLIAMQKEIDDNKLDHEKEMGKIRIAQDKTSEELKKVSSERDRYKAAAMKLIHATEEGINLRAKMSIDLNNCNACTIADQALLKALQEIKTLFENGAKENVN